MLHALPSLSRFAVLALAALATASCQAEAQPAPSFGDYWYQGQAEVTSYRLEQARYGEIHPGQAVMIFVTEDFSRSRQVKLDDPNSAGQDRVKVLKLNFTRKFNTGVYPYSMMTSVFTPVDPEPAPSSLKITTSSQEWCGHTFTQLNRTESGYRAEIRSYFESEGDETLELEAALPEDELWTLARLDPQRLPQGEVRLIPGTVFQRLRHVPLAVHSANAKLEPAPGHADRWLYTVTYGDLGRTLSFELRKEFPHEIEAWQETTTSGFGADAQKLTTRAERSQRMMLDYWAHHDLADAPLRQQLGLE